MLNEVTPWRCKTRFEPSLTPPAEILTLLRAGPLTAGQIAEKFPVSAAAVSRHLSVLKEADLVRDRREGNIFIMS